MKINEFMHMDDWDLLASSLPMDGVTLKILNNPEGTGTNQSEGHLTDQSWVGHWTIVFSLVNVWGAPVAGCHDLTSDDCPELAGLLTPAG